MNRLHRKLNGLLDNVIEAIKEKDIHNLNQNEYEDVKRIIKILSYIRKNTPNQQNIFGGEKESVTKGDIQKYLGVESEPQASEDAVDNMRKAFKNSKKKAAEKSKK